MFRLAREAKSAAKSAAAKAAEKAAAAAKAAAEAVAVVKAAAEVAAAEAVAAAKAAAEVAAAEVKAAAKAAAAAAEAAAAKAAAAAEAAVPSTLGNVLWQAFKSSVVMEKVLKEKELFEKTSWRNNEDFMINLICMVPDNALSKEMAGKKGIAEKQIFEKAGEGYKKIVKNLVSDLEKCGKDSILKSLGKKQEEGLAELDLEQLRSPLDHSLRNILFKLLIPEVKVRDTQREEMKRKVNESLEENDSIKKVVLDFLQETYSKEGVELTDEYFNTRLNARDKAELERRVRAEETRAMADSGSELKLKAESEADSEPEPKPEPVLETMGVLFKRAVSPTLGGHLSEKLNSPWIFDNKKIGPEAGWRSEPKQKEIIRRVKLLGLGSFISSMYPEQKAGCFSPCFDKSLSDAEISRLDLEIGKCERAFILNKGEESKRIGKEADEALEMLCGELNLHSAESTEEKKGRIKGFFKEKFFKLCENHLDLAQIKVMGFFREMDPHVGCDDAKELIRSILVDEGFDEKMPVLYEMCGGVAAQPEPEVMSP